MTSACVVSSICFYLSLNDSKSEMSSSSGSSLQYYHKLSDVFE